MDMLPVPYRVDRRRRETQDVYTLELRSVETGAGLPFAPGQFTMLYAFGIGEAPISISGDPMRPEPLVHTIRAVGAVTKALCAHKPGAVVGVRGPFGSAWPVDAVAGRDVLLVAGGLGLAPLRSAIHAILANRNSYGQVAILYGARHPDDLLFRKELEQWRGRFDLQVAVTVDSAGAQWRSQIGPVTTLLGRTAFDAANAAALVCGPEIMMRFTVQELTSLGVDPARVWISTERNMKCAIGFCGHCQLGPKFVCKDGPVFCYPDLAPYLNVREL